MRYLARRSIRSGDGETALRLAFEAVRLAPSILLAEPSRTLLTLAAAIARRTLPDTLFNRVERAAIHAAARRSV